MPAGPPRATPPIPPLTAPIASDNPTFFKTEDLLLNVDKPPLLPK